MKSKTLIYLGGCGHYGNEMFWHQGNDFMTRKYPNVKWPKTIRTLEWLKVNTGFSSIVDFSPLVKSADLHTEMRKELARHDSGCVLWFPCKKIKDEVALAGLVQLEVALREEGFQFIVNPPSHQRLDNLVNLRRLIGGKSPELLAYFPRALVLDPRVEGIPWDTPDGLVAKVDGSFSGSGILRFMSFGEFGMAVSRVGLEASIPRRALIRLGLLKKTDSYVFARGVQRGKKIIISEWIDSWSDIYNGYINAAIYFAFGRMTFAHPRISSVGWKVHASPAQRGFATLGQAQRSALIGHVLGIVGRNRCALEAIAMLCKYAFVRFDCVISAQESGLLKIVEIEIKGGPGAVVQGETLPMMEKLGFDVEVVRHLTGAGFPGSTHVREFLGCG